MATGQPKRAAGTRHIRVAADLADKVAWVALVEGVTAAELVGGMIRDRVEAEYAKVADRVAVIRRAEGRED